MSINIIKTKDNMKFYGIYKITNLVNSKMYIGQHVTSNLDDGYMGSGIYIKNAIKKYGKDAFTKEWLEFAENKEELDYLERVYVNEEWLARPDVYNLSIGGASHREFGKSTKQLISEKTKIAMSAKSVRDRCSAAHKGKTPWNKGKTGCYKWSDEQREKMHAVLSKPRPYMKGHIPPNKGQKIDEQAKAKISANTKKAMTIEVRRKIADANKKRIGMVYWNDGHRRVLAKECPGEGWVRGRTIQQSINEVAK